MNFINNNHKAHCVPNSDNNESKVYHEVLKILSKPEMLKNSTELAATIKIALNNDIAVSILSLNSFREAIKICLRHKELGLTSGEIAKIDVVTRFPPVGIKNDSYPGKEEHIKEAMKLDGITDPKNIMVVNFCDDNIKLAKEAGKMTSQVDYNLIPKPVYLDPVLKFIDHTFNLESLLAATSILPHEETKTQDQVRTEEAKDQIHTEEAKDQIHTDSSELIGGSSTPAQVQDL